MPADDPVEFASTPVGRTSSAANSATSEPIERLATDYVDRLRKGERPTIASYQQQHPELASGIGELFPTIAALEGLREEGGVEADPFGKAMLGEFRLLRELGRGGMGVVYLAEQPSLARRVALKVLPPSFARDANLRTRFQREARVVAGMSHPNITPVFAVGEGDGQPWFAMQLLHGVGVDQVIGALAAGAAVTLGNGGFAALVRRMRDGVPVLKAREDWQDAAWLYRHIARLVAAAADALHYAHQRGVLHRDVKPANLILDVDGRVWVNDFGLAKGAGDVDVTSAESITGTLLYLAPERFDGITDRRCDVYSLGLVLRELLTKQTAFPTDSRAKLIKAIAIDGVPPVRFHAPYLPADIAAIVDRACAKDPSRRYADAASLAKDLLTFADSAPTAPGQSSEPTIIRTAKPDESGLPIGRVAVLAGAVIAGWWWFAGSSDPVAAQPTPPAAPVAPQESPEVRPAPYTVDEDHRPPPTTERPPVRESLAPLVERLPTLPPVSDARFSDPPAPVESTIPPISNVPPAVPLPRIAPEPQHPPADSSLLPPRPDQRPPRPGERPPRPEDGQLPPPRRPGDPPPPGPGGRPPPPPR